MERLTVFETDKGHFAVRPMEWTGIWNADGKIQECGIRHTAIFQEREDAEWYVNMKNAEEQGLLLRLNVSIGSKVWYINGKFILEYEVVGYSVDRTGAWLMYLEHYADETDKEYSYNIDVDKIGKNVFLTKSEAEQKLKEIHYD